MRTDKDRISRDLAFFITQKLQAETRKGPGHESGPGENEEWTGTAGLGP